jgi:hypothetical protein
MNQEKDDNREDIPNSKQSSSEAKAQFPLRAQESKKSGMEEFKTEPLRAEYT